MCLEFDLHVLMALASNSLPKAEAGESSFSRLEASLASASVGPRPNSLDAKGVQRHAEDNDLNVDELDFGFNLDSSHYPLDNLRSLQQIFESVQCHQHLSNSRNFSKHTLIECLDITPIRGVRCSCGNYLEFAIAMLTQLRMEIFRRFLIGGSCSGIPHCLKGSLVLHLQAEKMTNSIAQSFALNENHLKT